MAAGRGNPKSAPKFHLVRSGRNDRPAPSIPGLEAPKPKKVLSGSVPVAARKTLSNIFPRELCNRLAALAERTSEEWAELSKAQDAATDVLRARATEIGALALDGVEHRVDEHGRSRFVATRDLVIGDVVAVEAATATGRVAGVDDILQLWSESTSAKAVSLLTESKSMPDELMEGNSTAAALARRAMGSYLSMVRQTVAQQEIARAVAAAEGGDIDRAAIDATVEGVLEQAKRAPTYHSIYRWVAAWCGLNRGLPENRAGVFRAMGPAAMVHSCAPNAAVRVTTAGCETDAVKADVRPPLSGEMGLPDDAPQFARAVGAHAVMTVRSPVAKGAELLASRLSDANLLIPVSLRGCELAHITGAQRNTADSPWGCSCARCLSEARSAKATGGARCPNKSCQVVLARGLLPEAHVCPRCGTEVAPVEATRGLATRFAGLASLYEGWEPYAAMSMGTPVDMVRLATDDRIEDFAAGCPWIHAAVLELRAIAEGNRHMWEQSVRDMRTAIEVLMAAFPSAPLQCFAADYMVPLATALDNMDDELTRHASRVVRAFVGQCYLGGGILENKSSIVGWVAHGGGLVGVAGKGTLSEKAQAADQDSGLIKSDAIAQVGLLLYPPTALSERFHEPFLRSLGKRVLPYAPLKEWAKMSH